MSPILLFLCNVLSAKIMDYLSLGKTPFQGPSLLGNLHSVDITRRIGSLICSSLTLNVIYTGRPVIWTFIVRETLLATQTTQKKSIQLKVPYAKNSKECAWCVSVGKAAQWRGFLCSAHTVEMIFLVSWYKQGKRQNKTCQKSMWKL